MTEAQIRILKKKTANAKARLSIQTEINNYEDAIRQGSNFAVYHTERINILKLELEKIK